jgi:site-specific DNA-methyltransferase (adenine-specific)
MEERESGAYGEFAGDGRGRQTEHTPRQNFHPTVKPVTLMRYLCRLITPPGGIVLDPFMGSGSTGCGAVMEGFNFIGIEIDGSYYHIAEKRIEHWKNSNQESLFQGDTNETKNRS